MKADIKTVLRHLGKSLPDEKPEVKGGKTFQCPLHPDWPGSLELVSENPAFLRCSHPGCMFRGGIVSLVALCRGIAAKDAASLFMPGAEMADALVEPMSADELRLFSDMADTQDLLKTYLAKCRNALRQSPEKARIRPGMDRTSARLLHPDVAMFLDLGDEVPPCLSEFRRPRYKGSTIILYPFTVNGDIARIEAYDTSDPLFKHVAVVTHPSAGVFGEDLVSGSKVIAATDDPQAVAAIYASCALSSHRPPPVAAFSAYPLPESLLGVSSIRLLSTSDYPVSDRVLVSTLSAGTVVPGAARTPRIRVAKSQKRAKELSSQDMDCLLSGSALQYDVQWVLARRLVSMAKRGDMQAAIDLLSSEDVPDAVRNLVRNAVESTPAQLDEDSRAIKDLASALSSGHASPSSRMRLANGRTIVREVSSLFELTPRGERNVLCNVGLSVDHRIVTSSGEDMFALSASAPGLPSVQVMVPGKRAGDPGALGRAVSSEYARRGMNPYVAFYQVRGCSWPDIIAKLSEGCVVSREISSLGVDGSSRVNLPEVALSASGSVSRQGSIFTIPENTLRLYSAVPMDTTSGVGPYKDLLEKCGNLYAAALTLGIMHAVYQMTFPMGKPESAERPARHLFYAETEPGIWGWVFKSLFELFSGGGLPPIVSYSNPAETFSSYSMLGTLPLIASVPTSGARFSSDLDASGRSMVGLLDTSTAVMTNGRVSAVYVTPSDDRPADRCPVSADEMERLRRSFVPFLSLFVREARIDAAYRGSSSPCVAAYLEACRIFGASPADMSDIAKNWFPGVGMNGATMFLDLLHRSLQDGGRPHVTVVNGPPQPGYSFTRRGQHVFVMDDVVVISHMVADMMTQASKGMCRFDRVQLGDEMRATGLLARLPSGLGIDGSRCWCMSRGAWEMRVVRPPVPLPQAVSDGTMCLEPQ